MAHVVIRAKPLGLTQAGPGTTEEFPVVVSKPISPGARWMGSGDSLLFMSFIVKSVDRGRIKTKKRLMRRLYAYLHATTCM